MQQKSATTKIKGGIMKTLSNPLLKFDTYIDIKTAMSQQAYPIVLNGCVDSQKAHFIPNLGEDFPCRFVLTYKEEKAKELYQDLSFFDPNTVLYPSRDVLFYSADVHSNHIERQRMDILKKIVEGKPLTIVACLDVFMEKMIPFEEFKEHCLTIDFESIIDTDALKLKLSELGYENSGLVEAPGQFGIRGGIIDIFPLTEELPVRIELWGDEVDSIRSFDTETQRSVEKLDEVQVYPATEIILSRNKIGEAVRRMKEEYKKQEEAFKKRKRLAEKERLRKMTVRTEEELLSFGTAEGSEALLSYFYEKTVSFLEYLPENTLFFIDEPHRVLEKGKTYEEEFFLCMQSRLEGGYVLPGQADLLFGYEEILSKVMVEPLILLSSVIQDYAFYKPKTICDIEAKSIFSYNNSFDQLIKDLEHWKKQNYRILLLSSSTTRAKRLAENIKDYGLLAYFAADFDRTIAPGEIMVASGRLGNGFEYPTLKFVVLVRKRHFQGKKGQKAEEEKPVQWPENQFSFGDFSR